MGVFAGWQQQQPVRSKPTSQPTCIFQSPHAILLLSLPPLSVAALTNFLPHCHSCAICLFGQPPHIQTISAEQLHVRVSTGVLQAIFCIIRIALVIHSSISDAAGLSLQAQGFHSYLRCKTAQNWNNKKKKNLPRGLTIAQLLSLLCLGRRTPL